MNVGTYVAPRELQGCVPAVGRWMRSAGESELGPGLICIRETITQLEAIFAEGLGRFDKSGEYREDGALSAVAWLKWKCRLSGGAAAERVGIARQLEKLPETREAFSKGEVGYQHVATLARTAENVGTAAVRQHEATLLAAAQTMDPGQFAAVAKDFEHRVDAESVLAEANRAYARRYLHLSEPSNGLVRLDGLLDAEGGAIVRTALNAVSSRDKDDERTAGQRTHDALIDLCNRQLDGGRLPDVGGQRPHLIITTTIENLAGLRGQGAGDLHGTAGMPAETVKRLACDSAVTRICRGRRRPGRSATDEASDELAAEISNAGRSVPPATRRALKVRDKGCIFQGCGRPPEWTDAHHVKHWIDGGPTTLENLVLLCRRHHRLVHEGRWRLDRRSEGRWLAIAPLPRRPAAALQSSKPVAR